MTEVWWRNPHNYIREIVSAELPEQLIAWDRGMLIKKKIDPVMHANVFFGANAKVRILAIGTQGTAELSLTRGLDNPVAVYPTWEYGEDFRILEEMVAHPLGEDAETVADQNIPVDERPVFGQEHRVVITNLPTAHVLANRPFYRKLAELQEEYPSCNIMLHGSYSFKTMFGMGFGSADFEPRSNAASGAVFLPNGKVVQWARAVGYMQWIELLGMKVTDLKEPRNRCIYSIKSAHWAAEHYNENINFRTRGKDTADPENPHPAIPTTNRTRTRLSLTPKEGDKVICNDCSLQDTCKHFRDGAVCSLPKSETSALAEMFESRSSTKIIDALGTIAAAQIERLEEGMENEKDAEVLDPEVTKLMNAIFKNGVTLAKLVDPTLTKPMVQINNGGAAAQVANANPKELAASVIRALEDQGIARENITAEMFGDMLRSMTGGETAAIEGRVLSDG